MVYINLGRFITTEEADRKLDQAIAESDVEKFQENHPIIDFIFHPAVKAYYSPRLTILKSQILQASNYIPKIV